MSDELMIAGADKVLTRFGEWPHFHDMEMISLHMDRSGANAPWIEFVVFVWTYTGRITQSGHYEPTTHSLIRFRCERVLENSFDDFNHQNVLDGLNFIRDDRDGVKWRINFPSIYGLGGELVCESVRVVDVVPVTADGQPVSG